MKLLKTISCISFILILLSCNKDINWNDEKTTDFKAVTNIDQEVQINDDLLKINALNLAVASIEIIGQRLQGADVSIIENNPITFNFYNNKAEEVYNLDVPIGTYESLIFRITLDDTESGVVFSEIDSEFSPELDQEMEIPLMVDNTIELIVLNNESEPLILVDESLLSFELFFDTELLFNTISPTIWNALIQANQGQTEIDLTSLVGAEFLQEVNEGIELSLSIKAIR